MIQQANEVIEASPVIVYRRRVVDNMLDAILYVSENVSKYGYSAEDFTSGRVPFEQTVFPDDLQFVGETLIGNLQNNIDEYEFEYRGIFPGDRVVWFTLQASIERDESGEAVLQYGTIIDITDIKKADFERATALAETQKLYETSQQLNSAVGLQEVLAATTAAIPSAKLERGYLIGSDVNEENEVENVRILANWDSTGSGKVMPVGTQFPATMFQAISLWANNEPWLINDFATEERLDVPSKKLFVGQGMKSAVMMPLFDGKKPMGGVLMESSESNEFTDADERALSLAGAQLSAILQNELLLQTTSERAQALATVADVSTEVTSIQDPQEALKQVVNLTKERFGFYHAHVYVMNEAGDTLQLVSGAGEIGDQMVAEVRTIPLAAEQSLVARAARTREGVTVNDVTADPNFLAHPLLPDTKAELAVPMIAGDEVLGVLDVQADTAFRFTQDDIDVLTTLASQVSAVLQNAEQYTALNTTRERLGEALDIAALAYWELDLATGNFLFSDDFYKRILHITTEEAGGNYMSAEKFATTYMHPEDGPAVAEYSKAAVETDDPNFEASTEVRYFCGDGKQRDILMRMRIIKDENGKTIKTFGTNQDITDRKQAEAAREAALAQTEKLFDISRKLNAAGDLQEVLTAIVESIESVEFDRAMLVSHDLDNENNIEALNFIATWAGTENAQVVPIGMVMPASGFPAVSIFEKPEIHLIDDYATDERFDEALKKWLSDQGVKSGLLMPLFDGDKPLAGVIVESSKSANFSEIERRLMELAAAQVTSVVQNSLQYEEVRRSEALVRDIINATPDWIMVKDLEHRYVMVNQGYSDSMHIPVEDFIGKNDIEVGFPEELVKGDPERGIRGFWADDKQVFETKEALLIERDIVQVDGKERIYSTLKTPLTDAAGNVTSVLIFARDVTEREDLLQETRSRAEQEALINAISQKIQATTSVESALQVAIRELGDSLGADKTSIRLGVDAGQRRRNK